MKSSKDYIACDRCNYCDVSEKFPEISEGAGMICPECGNKENFDMEPDEDTIKSALLHHSYFISSENLEKRLHQN